MLSELLEGDEPEADVEPDDDDESDEPVLRLNRGGPESESDESLEVDPELRGRGATFATASPGVISALGVPSSELETARRIRGGPSESPDELLDETFDELLEEELLVSPELDARRNRGRSGSSSPGVLEEEELLDAERLRSSELDELERLSTGLSGSPLGDDELLLTSSEFDDRRKTGRLGLLDDDELDEDGEPDEEELGAELLAEALDEFDELFDPLSGRGRGFVGSSAASDATECSSAVPSLTKVIVCAL